MNAVFNGFFYKVVQLQVQSSGLFFFFLLDQALINNDTCTKRMLLLFKKYILYTSIHILKSAHHYILK